MKSQKDPEPVGSDSDEDLLDSPDEITRFQWKNEADWTGRKNTIIDAHPFLAGYTFFAGLVLLCFATNLTLFVVSFLFLYLVSDFMTNDVRRLVPFVPKALLFSILYLAVIALFTVLFYNIIPNLIALMPGLAEKLQSQAITLFENANARWDLTQYVNPQEVKSAIVTGTTSTLKFLAGVFSASYKGFIYFIFALVLNLLLYHNTEKLDGVFGRRPKSLMNFFYRFVIARVRVFYYYFRRVMGGQIIISGINTGISTIVIFALGLPYPFLLIGAVFVFGLLPVAGNLISNTILTVMAFVTIGPWGAAICLGLLIGVHKLEYFLNSKIIGDIVHMPMFVTLTSLVVCEVLFGIVGLMLAIPLILFLRHEFEQIPGPESNAEAERLKDVGKRMKAEG